MKTIILRSSNNQLHVQIKVDLMSNSERFTIMSIEGRKDIEVQAGIGLQELPDTIESLAKFAQEKNLLMDIVDIDPAVPTINKVDTVIDLAITSEGALEAGVTTEPYHQPIETEGGNGVLEFTVSDGELPGGLYLDKSSGFISGVPEDDGEFTFDITVTDNFGQESTEEGLSISITQAD